MSDNRKVSTGGGPTRNTTLPTDAAGRKQFPIATGFLDYFPDAIAAVAALSKRGSDQHNPGKPMFWDRSKSTDEDDTAMRHFLQRGTLDNDGVRHTVKACWRMLAFLQKEIEAEQVVNEKPRELVGVYRGRKAVDLNILELRDAILTMARVAFGPIADAGDLLKNASRHELENAFEETCKILHDRNTAWREFR